MEHFSGVLPTAERDEVHSCGRGRMMIRPYQPCGLRFLEMAIVPSEIWQRAWGSTFNKAERRVDEVD